MEKRESGGTGIMIFMLERGLASYASATTDTFAFCIQRLMKAHEFG